MSTYINCCYNSWKCPIIQMWRMSLWVLTKKGLTKSKYHRDERGFKCDKCSYSAFKGRDLKYHQKAVHDTIKEFICDLCNYSCSRSSNLRQHLRGYLRVHELSCHDCNHATRLKRDLDIHIKAVHKKVKDLAFVCQECSASFGVVT